MSKVVRCHYSTQNDIKGVGRTKCVSIDDFSNVSDPLSQDGNHVNKPGASIPSLFARMIFFKMAFEEQNSGNSIYDSFVSQCLDLLEMVFNGDPSITIHEFNFTNQINCLRADRIKAHNRFADILDKQREKYMPEVPSVFLFEKDNVIIGGTSPYTLVYTSPNWKSGKEITPLIRRNSVFKDYLYKLHDAYRGANLVVRGQNDSFFEYIEKTMNIDGRSMDRNYSPTQLNNEFSPIKYNEDQDVNVDGQMYLHQQPQGQFDSDFFIASTQQNYTFDRETTPIVLTQGTHPGLMYYNGVLWNPNLAVPNISGNNSMPGNCPNHPNLRNVDFFEDKLLALPYPIDNDKFGRYIEISDGNGGGQMYSAPLPLKPILLTYFTTDELKDNNFLKITKSDGNSVTIQLNIPIRNAQGTKKNIIRLSKSYNLNSDVEYVYMKDLDNSFNIGISPFVKSTQNPDINKYYVMMALDEPSKLKNPELSFYKFGSSNPLQLATGALVPRGGAGGNGRKSWYVNVGDFDYIRVKLTNASNNDFYALIVPNFGKVEDGANEAFYGVDFGTTNTHIAYYDSNVQATKSFFPSDFQYQAVYLNKLSRTLTSGAVVPIDDKFRVIKAREFFPITTGDQYGFPFRTALYSEVQTDQQSEEFKHASIGFHYEKEYLPNLSYKTSLKWDLINGGNNQAIGNAKVFFAELMHLVRNHWLNQKVDHTQGPRIMLTYPLGQNTMTIVDYFKIAYTSVFGIDPDANDRIKSMTESLAPCQEKIFAGVNPVNGLLNVDIGGGTTDIQYYMQNGGVVESRFDSIVFAGDDLWGQAYENMGAAYAIQNQKDNNFTCLAKKRFTADFEIKVKGSATRMDSIKLEGKEFVNYLFRDTNNSFSTLLCNKNSDTEKCRLQLFMHYSAIVYHITNLLKQKNLGIPASVSFSGLGSKYLKLLFPIPNQEEQCLMQFTKALILKYNPQAIIPANFSIELRQQPKNATAEGAALSFYNYVVQNQVLQVPNSMTICSFNRMVSMSQITGNNCVNDMKAMIKEYLDGYRSVDLGANTNAEQYVPTMTDEIYEQLLQNCLDSYTAIANIKHQQCTNLNDQLKEPSFIWALKNSIWKI